jgi:hypothetical protein
MLEDPNKIVNWLKLSKAEEYAHQVSITAPKLAILVLYARIFTTRKYRMAFYITGGFVIASMISVIITSSVLCRPFAFNWDKTIPGGKCADIMSAYRYTCFPNIIADLVILILPMPAIYKLRVDTPVKIGLFITFVTGSMYVFCSSPRRRRDTDMNQWNGHKLRSTCPDVHSRSLCRYNIQFCHHHDMDHGGAWNLPHSRLYAITPTSQAKVVPELSLHERCCNKIQVNRRQRILGTIKQWSEPDISQKRNRCSHLKVEPG